LKSYTFILNIVFYKLVQSHSFKIKTCGMQVWLCQTDFGVATSKLPQYQLQDVAWKFSMNDTQLANSYSVFTCV